MANTHLLALAILLLGAGIVVGIRATRASKEIDAGNNGSRWKVFGHSISMGLAGGLVFMGVGIAVGLRDSRKALVSSEAWLGLALLSAVGALLITAGSLWQFFLVRRFREILRRLLKRWGFK